MDDYDDDDDFDSFEIDQADLDRIDALEGQVVNQKGKDKGKDKAAVEQGVEDDDDEFFKGGSDWDDTAFLEKIQEVEDQHQQLGNASRPPARAAFPQPHQHQHQQQRQPPQAIAGPSSRIINATPSSGSSSGGTGGKPRQRNLFGEVVPMQSSQGMLLVASKAHTAKATASQRMHNLMTNPNHRFSVAEQKSKRKEWDKSQPANGRKCKTSTFSNNQGDDEEHEASGLWDMDDSDFISAPPLPMPDAVKQMKVPIDREEAQRWIYPTNKEMRDYQFNIVQRALFNNVLVALPTGLGKTFIAAVVILNYYRWFPAGKIIFVAPTKPLVAQQQQACHGICGLPWDCAVEMTGGTKANLRGDEWKTKRIFYMTPQTFENDLCSTAVDAKDVVCVVVDEAHRATGNYAYCKVIQWITARNPFFRVLALTATPGNKPDKVQEVVDNLHINLIEIRTEEAVDIRKYVHTKKEDPVVVPLGGVVAEMRDLFAKMMKPLLEILNNNGLISVKDPCSLPPFLVTLVTKDQSKRAVVNQRKLFNTVTDLRAMATAMEYLVRYSVHMFYQRMSEMQSGIDDHGKKAATTRQKNKFSNNTIVQEIEQLYIKAQDQKGIIRHPKMEYLQNVVAAHFADEAEQGREGDSRVMVFCQYRQCVLEIVNILNEQHNIKATQFVGQANDNKGGRGMTQKEQEEVVKTFKAGQVNVLVATSIGEEGLDIGEVDLIICYEAVKNSVRMLQRVGRTGRKRNGRIVVLMSEGPEEKFWDHSKDNHKTIQNELLNGSHLELFDDVERLVPEDITSVAVLEEVEQPPFEPSMIRKPGRQKKVPKAKRDSDPYRNVPTDGFKGFVKVSDMKKKKKKAARKSEREGDSSASDALPPDHASSSDVEMQKPPPKRKELCLTDDSDDEQLERGIVIAAKTPAPLAPRIIAGPSSNNSTGGKTRGRLGAGRAPRKLAPPPSSEGRASASSQIIALPSSSSPVEESVLYKSPLQARRLNRQAAVELSDKQDIITQVPSTSTPFSPVKRKKRTGPHPLVARLAAELEDSDEEDASDEAEQQCGGKEILVSSSLEEAPIVSRKARTKESRRKVARLVSSSPLATMGPPATPSSVQTKKGGAKKRRMIGASPTSRRLFQYEADRSTDEEIHGEKDEHDDGRSSEENSSDLEHVGDFQPTQAPKGYKQDAIYLQSLLSQSDVATPFRRPARSHQAGFQMGVNSEQVRQYVQDTPRRQSCMDSGSEDDYEVDSFVCSDDEVVYETQRSSESVLVD